MTKKNFGEREFLVFPQYLVKTLIWRKYVDFSDRSRLTHCTVHTVEITEIYSHWKNISSNHLFSNFFSKTVTFTKFLPKKRESEFPYTLCTVFRKNSVKTNFLLQLNHFDDFFFLLHYSGFTKNFPSFCIKKYHF